MQALSLVILRGIFHPPSGEWLLILMDNKVRRGQNCNIHAAIQQSCVGGKGGGSASDIAGHRKG